MSAKQTKSRLLREKTSDNLTKYYILALATVALLTLTGQFLVQYFINDELHDSYVVNYAGKQRYKSQEIVKLCLLIYNNVSHTGYNNLTEELETRVDNWEQAQNALRYSNGDFKLAHKNSFVIKKMYADIDTNFKMILASAKQVVVIGKDSIADKTARMSAAIEIIINNEQKFLKQMDIIVHRYDNEAREKVEFLQRIELILLIVTLLVLMIEGLFIFRPAAQQINDTMRELIFSEEHASDLAEQLQQSLKDLQDINIALENATILARTDRDGIITYVNDEFCHVSGYTREELMGHRFDVLSAHYHSRIFFDKLWETISSGKIWNDEIKNKARDGNFFWLDATIVPIIDLSGEHQSYLAIYTDITQKFKQSINEQKIRSASLIEGQEKERRKIARDLHDGLGQRLTALKFHIEGLKVTVKEKARYEEIKKILYETIVDVRRISFNLMPSVLNDFGIIPAVKLLAEQTTRSSSVNVIFENNSVIERLSKTVEINVYRIVQEALTNAIKYAEADEVKIIVEDMDSAISITIADNGKGFDSDNLSAKAKEGSGNGIANIQERTSLINGEFSIETAPGKGTKIMINIPLILTA